MIGSAFEELIICVSIFRQSKIKIMGIESERGKKFKQST